MKVSDEEARTWYHRHLPGGMPRDWINDAFSYSHDPEWQIRAATAALLSVAGHLHIDRNGFGTTRGHCVLCNPEAPADPAIPEGVVQLKAAFDAYQAAD